MKQYDITIESGADFYFPHRLKDDSGNLINLTGATVSAQLREYPEALDAFDFTCSHNGLGGQVILTMPHEATAQIGYTAGFYDVFVEYADETVEKVLWGAVTIQPNVTKPIAGTPMVLLSFASEDDFPRNGIITRMYFSHASSKLYRWNGTAYIGIQQDVTWETLEGKPDTFPPDAHQHDDRYYTEQETDSLLSDKADADSVYTKTEVDTALSSKAPIIRTSASGSLVHITDAAAMPVESLTVGIEPVQDLHGQSAPYPAGGGVNKLSPFVSDDYTGSTISSDGLTVTTGTRTDNNLMRCVLRNSIQITENATYYISFDAKLVSGTCLRFSSVTPVDSGGNSLCNYRTTVSNPDLTSSKQRYKFYATGKTDGGTGTKFYIQGADTSNAVIEISNVCVSLTENYTFAPYSNVCPISGHTSAVVTRTGKNLFTSGWEQGSINHSGDNVNDNTIVRTIGYISVIPNQEYSMTRTITTSYNNVRCYDKDKNFIGIGTDYVVITGGSGSSSNPIGAEQSYCAFKVKEPVYYIRLNDTSNNLTTKYMMVAGNVSASQVGDYVAPVIQTVTIDLNGERYGGTVDALTGVMTVTRQLNKIKDLNWDYNPNVPNRFYSNTLRTIIKLPTTAVERAAFVKSDIYRSSNDVISQYTDPNVNNAIATYSDGYIYIIDRNYTSASDFKTARGEVQICYLLATPFTVQLTPAELSLLYGTNNVWAETGDVSVGYRADTKLYIDRKIAELQALILDN